MPYKNIVFVKLEKRLFNDPRWYMMSDLAQLNYIRLILFAAETYNKIPRDISAIRKAFKTTQPSERVLRSIKEIQRNFPKLRCNKDFYYFVDFEQKTNYIPEELQRKSRGTPKDGVDKEEDIDLYKDKKNKTLTPEGFLESLKSNTAYKHIDIENELAKMDAWLLTHTHRKKTKAFILNWLKRIEKPFGPVAKKNGVPLTKCPVPGCTAQPMPADQFPAHRESCEKRFKDASGPMSPEIRKLINVACGREENDDGPSAKQN